MKVGKYCDNLPFPKSITISDYRSLYNYIHVPNYHWAFHTFQEINDNAISNANLVTWEGLLDEHVATAAAGRKIIGMEDDEDDDEEEAMMMSDNEDNGNVASPAGERERERERE